MSKNKIVFGFRIRGDESENWSEPYWYLQKKKRDEAASINRLIGGLRTWSFQESKTAEEIEKILSEGAF